MEIQGELSKATTTQAKLARYLELSKARVNQLVDEKVVIRDESDAKGKILAFDSIRNYYLSQQSSDSGVNFWKEKGLHERAKRELAELKLQERRGELYEAAVVESVMIEHLTNFRTKLLGLPPKIAAKLPADIRGEVYDDLTREIENCLDELAKNYHDADLKSVEVEDADIDEELADDD